VDAWCIGVTLLRCLTGKRCPLGTSHTSIRHITDKVTDALLSISSQELRSMLAGLLDMNAENRMQFLKNCPLPPGYRRPPPANDDEQQPFKSTTFIPTTRKHRLSLYLEAPGGSISRSLSRLQLSPTRSDGSSQSRSRSTGPPSSRERSDQYELALLNPDQHTFLRVVSFLKYSLRCSGIVYHVWPSNYTSLAFSVASSPDPSSTPDPFASTPYERPSQSQYLYLRCVVILASEEGLLAAFRPPLIRAATANFRSASTPPAMHSMNNKTDKKVRCLSFWMSITAETTESYFPVDKEHSIPSKVIVRISDAKAMPHIKKALGLDSESSISTPATTQASDQPEGDLPQEERGRSSDKRPLLARNPSEEGKQVNSKSSEHVGTLALGIF
jgi:hypothetical protein